MKDTKFRILLDIHEVRSQATIPVKVGDVSCKIYITLVEGGKPYKIHENSFGVFTGKKGDDKHLFNNCVIENGIIRYDFTPQTVAAAGVLECEVRIYDEDGGVLTTPSFNIIVDERAVNDSELASSDEFSFLDEILVNEGQRIQNEKNRNEAFNNLGIDLEDDGEVISIVKTDIDGSQEKSTFLKYADVIPPVTATASGSAITIDSAKAPLQNLKLYGKTTQNGTPTPDAPVPLVSVGDSGSFEVGVYGQALIDLKNYTVQGSPVFSYKGNKIHYENTTGVASAIRTKMVILTKGTYTAYAKNLSIQGGMTIGVQHSTMAYITSAAQRQVFTLTKPTSVFLMFTTNNTNTIGSYDCYCGIVAGNVPLEQCPVIDEDLPDIQTLTMPYTLPSFNECKDEIDFARGVRIQKVIKATDFKLNGTYTNTDLYVSATGLSLIGGSNNMAICNVTTNYAYNTQDDVHFYAHTSGNINVYVPKGYDIASKPIEVIAVLQTPIETALTETELNDYRQLYTNKGTTTILSECEDTEVTYYINKPNAQAIGNIHSQVNEDYFKLQQAIISLGGN